MGIFNKIKTIFSKEDTTEKEENSNVGPDNEYDEIIKSSSEQQVALGEYFYEIKLNKIATYTDKVAKWSDKKKIDFIEHLTLEIKSFIKTYNRSTVKQNEQNDQTMRFAYLEQLFKTKLAIDATDLDLLLTAFETNEREGGALAGRWPILGLLNQLVRQYKGKQITEEMRTTLQTLRNQIQSRREVYFHEDKLKWTEKIDTLIFTGENENDVKPVLFLGEDDFAVFANSKINALSTEEKNKWYLLVAKAQKASGSKPSKKFLDETKVLMKDLGTEKFKAITHEWFLFVVNFKDKVKEHTSNYNNETRIYYSYHFISSIHNDTIKGFIWMCSHFHDNSTLQVLSKLAERCYKKIPGQGPAAAGVGNACLFSLYNSKGLDGIGLLSRLKLRIKQSNTQNIIQNYIELAAVKNGVTTHEIEDMAVENFKLIDGVRVFEFDDYTCILKIAGIGKSELNWKKPDGTDQKTAPSFVKEKYAEKLKKVKEIQKQVDQTTSAQRDRIDRMFRTNRSWNFDNFNTYYLNHGLMSFLTKKIIWNFTFEGITASVIYWNDQWVTNDNKPLEVALNEQSSISLWHPALHTVSEIKKWRDFLVQHQIQQPLKQAYREVYLLTEAELNTKSYSNRMAAHVLKQHQFNMLAKTRGWKYSLMGCYDDGRENETAEINLPEYGLRAEYWVNELNADEEYNDTGIWNYITTDQIRFINTETGNVVDLVDVPPLPFSEILRDVDLFVGVASVANDPTWQDSGGIPAYRDYWTSYSFGDLTEVAKNRKEILSTLIPRLKIKEVTEIKDKFLIVKGKLRTYKIHIGSTNILMEPNDQYLCIVADRSKKDHAHNLFIPFDGDTGLSIILSKAFLLAEDDKITDTTITSQINRK